MRFVARLFDADGREIGERDAAWSLEGDLQGTLDSGGEFTAGEVFPQGGHVVATVGDLKGVARVALKPAGGFREDFERYEIGAVPGGWSVRARAVPGRRGRGREAAAQALGQPAHMADDGVCGQPSAAGLRSRRWELMSKEQRRRMADMGLVSHRYTLALMGNAQSLMIRTWLSELERFSKEVPFAWDPDQWYRAKLRVEPHEDGSNDGCGARSGPRDADEPAGWTIEATDPLGHSHGSPGIYGYSSADIYYDNLVVRPFGD